jgi:hypothetical protein
MTSIMSSRLDDGEAGSPSEVREVYAVSLKVLLMRVLS